MKVTDIGSTPHRSNNTSTSRRSARSARGIGTTETRMIGEGGREGEGKVIRGEGGLDQP